MQIQFLHQIAEVESVPTDVLWVPDEKQLLVACANGTIVVFPTTNVIPSTFIIPHFENTISNLITKPLVLPTIGYNVDDTGRNSQVSTNNVTAATDVSPMIVIGTTVDNNNSTSAPITPNNAIISSIQPQSKPRNTTVMHIVGSSKNQTTQSLPPTRQIFGNNDASLPPASGVSIWIIQQ